MLVIIFETNFFDCHLFSIALNVFFFFLVIVLVYLYDICVYFFSLLK